MLINLSIKGVPEPLAEQLRTRAERNHRSLQGELMAIIESAVAEPASAPQAVAAPLAARPLPLAAVGLRRGTRSIEDITADHLRRFPSPIAEGPMAVDILRADRDAR